MLVFHTGEIVGRNQFPALLKSKGLHGHAVEVGTHRGEFAATLLAAWNGRLTCVDPWKPDYDPEDPASCGDRQADYQTALITLQPYMDRVRIMHTTSEEACKAFHGEGIEFCYIDGNHQYEYVKRDIHDWWPKLVSGGILAGHDIVCPGTDNGSWGRYVQPAVLEFAAEHSLVVRFVIELDGSPWSYYMEKP